MAYVFFQLAELFLSSQTFSLAVGNVPFIDGAVSLAGSAVCLAGKAVSFADSTVHSWQSHIADGAVSKKAKLFYQLTELFPKLVKLLH
jgi:hypothetical protein